MLAACMKAITEKEWKTKKNFIDVKFSTDKEIATTQDHKTLQNFDEKQYCRYWTLRLVVFYKVSSKQRLLVETLNVS